MSDDMFYARVCQERDALRAELAAAKDLLARIHRDGGHHTEAVGFAQSVADAGDRVSEWLLAVEDRDALAADNARLREVMEKIDREMSDIAEGKQEEIRNDLTAGESHGWTAAYDHVGPIILAALAATPAQSLAAHDAAVKVEVLDQIKARLYALASKEQDQPYGYDMNPRQWAATCLECAAEDVTAMQDEIISEADRIEKEAANGEA